MSPLNNSQSCVKFNIKTTAKVCIISLLNRCTKKFIKYGIQNFLHELSLKNVLMGIFSNTLLKIIQ